MSDAAQKKRTSVSPEDVVKSFAGLTGMKRRTFIGSLPSIHWDPRAEGALKGFYDLRAFAYRFLDAEFLTAIRPIHTEQALMFDSGLDAIGYAAFVLSGGVRYPGTEQNLRALHHYLVNTPGVEIEQYDLAAFLIVLLAACEAVPELAARAADLQPLLAEERIFKLAGHRPSEFTRILRDLFRHRQQFAKHLGDLHSLNDAVAAFFPLLQHGRDETVLGYRELMEKIRAGSRQASDAAPPAETTTDLPPVRKRISRRKKPTDGGVPDLSWYLPPSDALADRVIRPDQLAAWPIVPATVKDLYLRHGRELGRAQRMWDQYAKETWPAKSSMRWQIADHEGTRPLDLTQRIVDPFSQPLEMKLAETAEEEQQTEAIFLFNLSVSMQDFGRYLVSFMLADRFSEFLTRGGIPTEIIGHTTAGEPVPGIKGRNRAMLYLLFKMREEPHSLQTIQRLCSVLDTRLHYLSYDGEALLWAYDRLKDRPAKHRILFVATDGDVSGTYINKNKVEVSSATAEHFCDVVSLIEAEKRVTLIGLSIKADANDIFARSIRIDGIEDIYGKLSPEVLALLRAFNSDEGEAARARGQRMVAYRKARVAALANAGAARAASRRRPPAAKPSGKPVTKPSAKPSTKPSADKKRRSSTKPGLKKKSRSDKRRSPANKRGRAKQPAKTKKPASRKKPASKRKKPTRV